jgi:PKD repeat protein
VTYNFGEGEGTSSERSTSHICNIFGTYYATQTVTNPDNPAGVNTKTVIVTVTSQIFRLQQVSTLTAQVELHLYLNYPWIHQLMRLPMLGNSMIITGCL